MAKPIEGIPAFKGKALAWLDSYLKRVQPDPDEMKRAEEEKEAVARRVKPLAE